VLANFEAQVLAKMIYIETRRFVFSVVVGVSAPLALAAQIKVGANVQVSAVKSNIGHKELWAGAHLSNPDRLIVCSTVQDVKNQPDSSGTSDFYVSHDRGKTWKLTLAGPDKHHGGDPVCGFGPDGSAYALALARGTLIYRSRDGGLTWDRPPAVIRSVDLQAVAYALDREAFAVDNSGGKYHGRMYLHANASIPTLDGRNQPFGLHLFRSLDSGRTFLGPTQRVGGQGESQSPNGNGVVLNDGTFISTFGVRTVPWTRYPPPVPGYLAVVRSTDGGESLEPAIKVSDQWPGVIPTMAVDLTSAAFKDRLYIAWEGHYNGRMRILLSVSRDNGKTWLAARPVDDPRPHNDTSRGPLIPVVGVNKDGVVGVSWYDERERPDGTGWDMRFAASIDGGETWMPSVRVSTGQPWKDDVYGVRNPRNTNVAGTREGVAVGFVVENFFHEYPGHTNGIAVGADGTFHVFWVDSRTGTSQVWTAPVQVAGPAFRNGSAELAQLVDVSDKVTVNVSQTVYDHKTGTLTTILRVKNTSTDTIRGPVRLRLISLESNVGQPSTRGSVNGIDGVGAVWNVPLDGANSLAPGVQTDGVKVTLVVNNASPFDGKGERRTNMARPVFRVLAGGLGR
jgi:hypothetical protein